ncbi:trans-sulfuration enzyme family protein [Sedimenticola sp.]|uniref:trans-sulfuration enzyme family protein n=1 Tax=Sedimenticola sp. TaxID=1940285 RepID=UPI003D0CF9FB
MNKNTQCVHGGSGGAIEVTGINTPVYTSTAYHYLDSDKQPYPRYFNTPNQDVVVAKLCALEQTEAGLLFGSGMAAISTTLFSLLSSGDHVVLQDQLYGGTFNLVMKEFERLGIRYTLAASDADSIVAAVRDDTRVIYLESPTNPLLTVVDLRSIATMAKRRGMVTVVDNTFASPINQNPSLLGIDLVIHSGTKYLAGHSDLSCGAVLGSQALVDRIRALALNFGGCLNAQDAVLLERSLKTLALRVERQTHNAAALAEFLGSLDAVSAVYYPGLPSHPSHSIARSQMNGYGAMLGFELADDAIDSLRFQRNLKLIAPVLSLGGVESSICAPAITSHRHLSPAQRADMGVRDGLLRLSVGIEDVADLQGDILQALEQ